MIIENTPLFIFSVIVLLSSRLSLWFKLTGSRCSSIHGQTSTSDTSIEMSSLGGSGGGRRLQVGENMEAG